MYDIGSHMTGRGEFSVIKAGTVSYVDLRQHDLLHSGGHAIWWRECLGVERDLWADKDTICHCQWKLDS